MRSNLPISNLEYVLKDYEAPTSKTDIHGNITYVNQDFINVSGFGEDELLGQPQNIVRHPDMPKAAFADLWATIRSGKAWTGVVKNRCKNGDHYWVEASVAPIVVNDVITGYTSVRAKPSREQIETADRAYRAIHAGDKTFEIHEGFAIKRTRLPYFNTPRTLSLKALLVVAVSSIGTLFAGMGGLAWFATTANDSAYLNGLMLISGAGVPLAALFGVLTFRSLVVPLERVRQEMDRISAGDLTGRLETKGIAELSRLMNSLRVLQINLRWAVGQIAESTERVNLGSGEIAAGNASLSARTESQASSLEETASSIGEFTSTVKQNAEHALHASQLVSSTAEIATNGGEVVRKVINTMGSIERSSHKIADIIGVIDGIAFQTNILALNAAVEAARAGEQGRGFAVVASEVRNLAQRSAGAAKEIKALISDSVEQVGVGRKLVDEAGEAMDDIVTSVQLVADIISGTATSSQEQSAGIEQINQAVGQMEDITQKNAALGEQAAAAAESLQVQASKLAQLVETFKLSQRGNARPTRSGSHAASRNSGAAISIAARPHPIPPPGGSQTCKLLAERL